MSGKRRLEPPVYELVLADTRIRRGGKSERAARMVLVDGISAADAGRAVGISRQAVDCTLGVIERALRHTSDCCPMCGQGWPENRRQRYIPGAAFQPRK